MDIYERLPEDLQRKVVRYFVFPQNSCLLVDIRDFKVSKELIVNNYLANGLCSNEDYFHNYNAFSWIENDLMRYWNDEVSYIDNITDNNYKKMSRLLAFNIKYAINKDKALINFHFNIGRCPKQKINIYIGCLTIEERKEFCNICRVI